MMLKNKVAIVTGGTRGIGFAVVKKFIENGAAVSLWGSRQETVDQALEQLKELYPDAKISGKYPSLKDTAQVTAMINQVKEEFGAVDILVNNAGISQSTSFYNYQPEEFQKIVDLNGYPASKFAVNGLTKSLARELGCDNIRVNAVAPGITRTDMVAALPEAVIKPLIATIPLGRVGEPEDIANAFLFLASDMASYVTGEILSVDGAARS